MSVLTPTPQPNGTSRAVESKERRDLASTTAFLRPSPTNQGFNPPTRNNGEENLFSLSYSMNFSKGLPRDTFGNVLPNVYEAYVEAINTEKATASPGGPDIFESTVPVGPHKEPTAKLGTLGLGHPNFFCTFQTSKTGRKNTPEVRTFESPRAGHVYDLEGPDADAVCMPPAPKVMDSELAVEMAEVYAMALLRDVPFQEISDGSGAGHGYTVANAAKHIAGMDWFKAASIHSQAEENRRAARGLVAGRPKENAKNLFRGAETGAKLGPYLSQFLLIGSGEKNPDSGKIDYGAQQIEQRVASAPEDVDYMTEWFAWLDVQNGADFKKADPLDRSKRRFIATPRDLATYVHLDQLYQAYLNACLILLEREYPFESGFPSGGKVPQERDPSNSAPQTRGSFATFGGPHILALLTEVSTRALRAVRRQKFNYHRRCRPEMIGGMLTVAKNVTEAQYSWDARGAFDTLQERLPKELLAAVDKRATALEKTKKGRQVEAPDNPKWLKTNFLLPMAFPEGSPMHPSYGAGHATVAGACVTVLKAFFEMYEPGGNTLKPFDVLNKTIYQATPHGDGLEDSKTKDKLTVAGELDKLAANISIGRNMAGVHFYTDYYDSLRMGERIAVGILQEQMTNYPERVSMRFPGFDDHEIKIESRIGATVTGSTIALSPVVYVDGVEASDDWWTCLRGA